MHFQKIIACFFVLLLMLCVCSVVAFADDVTPTATPAPTLKPLPGIDDALPGVEENTETIITLFTNMFTGIFDLLENIPGGINFAAFLALSLAWIPTFYWRIFAIGLALGCVGLVIKFVGD